MLKKGIEGLTYIMKRCRRVKSVGDKYWQINKSTENKFELMNTKLQTDRKSVILFNFSKKFCTWLKGNISWQRGGYLGGSESRGVGEESSKTFHRCKFSFQMPYVINNSCMNTKWAENITKKVIFFLKSYFLQFCLTKYAQLISFISLRNRNPYFDVFWKKIA